ncbi:hypothetical protein ABPG77_007945 [Micractinium sp. CCAP 211/92]
MGQSHPFRLSVLHRAAAATSSVALPLIPALPLHPPTLPLQPISQDMRVENNGIPPMPSQAPRREPASGGGLFGRNW